MHRIDPVVNNFDHADTIMHPNICSYAKAVLEEFANNDYEGIILTTCCDSIKRLHDVLIKEYPDKFIYLLDVPRKTDEEAVKLYENGIREMVRSYEEFSGKSFDEEKLQKVLDKKRGQEDSDIKKNHSSRLKIGIAGARCSSGISELLKEKNVDILFDMTCTGMDRDFHFRSYADELLNQIPCMRMVDYKDREKYRKDFYNQLDGIIYHTIKFCDNYSYEYAMLKENVDIPVLQVETDATKQGDGQIKTRVEAFLESINAEEREKITLKNVNKEKKKFYVLGIDSGSTSTNAVILNEKKEIISYSVVRTGAKSRESSDKILQEVLNKAGLKRADIDRIVSTGYGRVSIPFADKNVTEISCHGKGAHYFNPDVRTILDIGGQDSKAIKLSEKGEVLDFVMNDKCAAGTGRFLEMMARTLELNIDELGPVSADWKEDIEISSMCSVFAESEVISLIANNKEKADIAHGVHKAIASKACSLLNRIGIEEVLMMTGGVAKNQGVVQALEEKTGKKLFICEEPEIVGAVGAALFGLED